MSLPSSRLSLFEPCYRITSRRVPILCHHIPSYLYVRMVSNFFCRRTLSMKCKTWFQEFLPDLVNSHIKSHRVNSPALLHIKKVCFTSSRDKLSWGHSLLYTFPIRFKCGWKHPCTMRNGQNILHDARSVISSPADRPFISWFYLFCHSLILKSLASTLTFGFPFLSYST